MNQQASAPLVEEMHLRDYLRIIASRKRTFIVSFLAVFTLVALYTFCQAPLYESSATLFVKDDKGKVGQIGDLLLGTAAPVDSELEILKSRSNVEKVVATLHLDCRVDKMSDGVGFRSVEFSSSAKVPVCEVRLLGGGNYQVLDRDGKLLGQGASNVALHGNGISLLVKELRGGKGDSFRVTQLPFNATVDQMRRAIRATEVGKKTNVISIYYRNRDPLLARDVVNTMVQAYLDQGRAVKAEEATRTIGFIEEQLQGIRTDLDRAEKNLQFYKSASGVIQLDAEAENLIRTLTEAETQKITTKLQRKQVEFALGSLREARKKGQVYSPAVLRDDPLVAGMAARLAELEVQKKGLLSESTEVHPGVRGVQAQIDEVQKQIQATYETSLSGMGQQEENIGREILRHDAQLKKLPVAERDLARLTRLSKVNADIYTFLLQKREEARIAKASTISNINVVDPAIAADEPVAPKYPKNLLLGLLAGLLSGGGLCFFREYLDDTLKDPEQVKRTLALPLLAVIPHIPAQSGGSALISHDAPGSSASEAFRYLRTELGFRAPREGRQVLLVTSSFAGEGKSLVAANLAVTLAHAGARVLVVDCDLRHSVLHREFGQLQGQGLTDFLTGGVAAAEVIRPSRIAGLDLLQAGSLPPRPAELLGSRAMAHFVGELRNRYSHIIIDAPPVLAVSDAPVLTRVSDQVILVLESGRVSVKAALRTREVLTAAATPILGVVISDRNAHSAGFGYGYGDGFGYRCDERPRKRWWRRK